MHREVKPRRVKFKVKAVFVLIWCGWMASWLGCITVYVGVGSGRQSEKQIREEKQFF